ncbi:hypothetical protein BDV39DRAFT_204253 [Aspergillus sergii]|uniref:Uncharacterized protein n=1 Tax=Aspergillus sergii TaxID=1034303 RepID=A0A5N6X4K4_9EURO|nr:hypothetical protein BDV39DRAFT_204253 [Aspergillus sergii]
MTAAGDLRIYFLNVARHEARSAEHAPIANLWPGGELFSPELFKRGPTVDDWAYEIHESGELYKVTWTPWEVARGSCHSRYQQPGVYLARSRAELLDALESGKLDPVGEEVNMLAKVRRYIELLRTMSFRDFSTEDKSKALLAFKRASQMAIRNSQVFVSTNNNVGDCMIASNFGLNTQGIIVIRYEDTKECETNAWIPLTKLLRGDRVTESSVVMMRNSLDQK